MDYVASLTWNGWPLSVEYAGLHNLPLDYTSFAEIYQRKKRGLPGISPVGKYNADILAADWIDEAMALAREDRRFALPDVEAVTESERMADPGARYVACLQKPTVDCLLASGVEHAIMESGRSDEVLSRAAVAVIPARRPQYAIALISQALERSRLNGNQWPSPRLAPVTALKAQAELLVADKTAADKSLDEAFVNATAPQRKIDDLDRNSILLSARTLARAERLAQARLAYDLAAAERAPLAYELLAEIGLAHARAGRIDAALRVAQELRQPLEADASAPGNRPGGETLANAMRTTTAGSQVFNVRKEGYLLARAAPRKEWRSVATWRRRHWS